MYLFILRCPVLRLALAFMLVATSVASADAAVAPAPVPAAFTCGSVSEIPTVECQALVDFFTDTLGGIWTRNDGWLQTDTPCGWYGVRCAAGHVSAISLRENGVNNGGVSALGGLLYLTRLDLSLNGISRDDIWHMLPVSLQELYLPGTNVYGSIPTEVARFANLRVLILAGSRLSGKIPPALGQLGNLKELDLAFNYLSGPIPSELGNLTHLRALYLNDNRLDGPIPLTLANLTALEHLMLQDNRLTGPIPPGFGGLIRLQRLWLRENQLSGTVPYELANLKALQQLLLGDNPLTGPLPRNLIGLPLNYLDFGDTGVCEPDDPAFDAWVAGIPQVMRTGKKCTFGHRQYLPLLRFLG